MSQSREFHNFFKLQFFNEHLGQQINRKSQHAFRGNLSQNVSFPTLLCKDPLGSGLHKKHLTRRMYRIQHHNNIRLNRSSSCQKGSGFSGRDNSGRQGYAATQESDAFEMRRNGADAAAAYPHFCDYGNRYLCEENTIPFEHWSRADSPAMETRRAAGTRAGRCRAGQSEPFDQLAVRTSMAEVRTSRPARLRKPFILTKKVSCCGNILWFEKCNTSEYAAGGHRPTRSDAAKLLCVIYAPLVLHFSFSGEHRKRKSDTSPYHSGDELLFFCGKFSRGFEQIKKENDYFKRTIGLSPGWSQGKGSTAESSM
ncbi:unnamed protein product [Nesidiocoris tenuis]|uniref:Uncharacterized protein n=1 Tax=Nesidiocoris tenuis TaxID=355587 RepID=A0A6H5HR65_9HEMI|nr:unnamed protein product [Nesidiocoris tenuis]